MDDPRSNIDSPQKSPKLRDYCKNQIFQKMEEREHKFGFVRFDLKTTLYDNDYKNDFSYRIYL